MWQLREDEKNNISEEVRKNRKSDGGEMHDSERKTT